jgi:hypothetical protein
MNNLTKGFKELRKNGYFARQNHTCCQFCGWSEVPNNCRDKVVFYHNQEKRRKDNGESFNLNWSGDGYEIQRILKECGVETKWDGSEYKTIEVVSW